MRVMKSILFIINVFMILIPYITDRNCAAIRVKPGEYKVVLSAGDRVLTRPALILQDYWYK